jgi:hypothetical protein
VLGQQPLPQPFNKIKISTIGEKEMAAKKKFKVLHRVHGLQHHETKGPSIHEAGATIELDPSDEETKKLIAGKAIEPAVKEKEEKEEGD